MTTAATPVAADNATSGNADGARAATPVAAAKAKASAGAPDASRRCIVCLEEDPAPMSFSLCAHGPFCIACLRNLRVRQAGKCPICRCNMFQSPEAWLNQVSGTLKQRTPELFNREI